MPKLVPGPAPTGPKTADSPAAKLYKRAPGYANQYFNDLERDRLLTAVRKLGDFSAVGGAWAAEGRYAVGERQGEMRFEVSENKEGSSEVSLKTNLQYRLDPLR